MELSGLGFPGPQSPGSAQSCGRRPMATHLTPALVCKCVPGSGLEAAKCVGLLLALIKMLSHSVKAKSIKEPGAAG